MAFAYLLSQTIPIGCTILSVYLQMIFFMNNYPNILANLDFLTYHYRVLSEKNALVLTIYIFFYVINPLTNDLIREHKHDRYGMKPPSPFLSFPLSLLLFLFTIVF